MRVGKTAIRCRPLRRSYAAIVRYALAAIVVVGGPVAMVFLLGTPEPALPSEWADARSRIDDGTYAASYVVDIVSGLGLLAWLAGLWLAVMGVRKQRRRRRRDTTEETDISPVGLSRAKGDNDTDHPWYRQGPPLFDEPFTDEHPRIVVPPDETAPGEEPADSPWQPAPVAAGIGEPFGMLPPDPMAEDMIADAEIIAGGEETAGTAGTMGEADAPSEDEPPMIVPVRAYYFTRAQDTLRSISAQFLNTPGRWEELRSLNAASLGVSAMGPDSLLPVGTALALPGDPLPWGKPDPVYLWTLAEKFLFTAWGREPTPEEVVPFWRGLTGGAQLEAGAPPVQVEHLAPPAFTEAPAPEIPTEAAPEPDATVEETPEPDATEVTLKPAATAEAAPEPDAAVEEALAKPPTPEVPAEPAATEPPPPEVPDEPEPEPADPPVPDVSVPAPPPAPGVAPPITPPPYHSPVPPSHEPAHEPAAYQPPPGYEPPVPPTHEPAPPYHSPMPPAQDPTAYQPPAPPYHSPVPPTHEPAPPYHSPMPPAQDPTAYQPPAPPYHSPVPPTHEPAPPYHSPMPPAQDPTAYQPPAPPYQLTRTPNPRTGTPIPLTHAAGPGPDRLPAPSTPIPLTRTPNPRTGPRPARTRPC